MESKCTVNIVDHPIIHVIPSLPVARIRLLGPASIKPYSSARNRDSVVSIMEGGIMLEMMDGERYMRSHHIIRDHMMWDHMMWGFCGP